MYNTVCTNDAFIARQKHNYHSYITLTNFSTPVQNNAILLSRPVLVETICVSLDIKSAKLSVMDRANTL